MIGLTHHDDGKQKNQSHTIGFAKFTTYLMEGVPRWCSL